MGDGEIVDFAFSPYTAVFRNIEVGELAETNESTIVNLIHRIRDRDGKIVRTSSDVVRGVLSRGWSISEVAQILEDLQFSSHNPEREAVPLREHHRNTDTSRPVRYSFSHKEDPYRVAAYLRAWEKHCADERTVPPAFNVGISFGERDDDTMPFDFPLVTRQVTTAGRVIGGWTGRSANWDGDVFFDAPNMRFRVEGSQQRLEGADGLLLVYIIHKGSPGKSGIGGTRKFHSPMIGISIPAGGPHFRRVVV
jgi:hypothetical protein